MRGLMAVVVGITALAVVQVVSPAAAQSAPACNPTGGSGGLAPGMRHDINVGGRPLVVYVGKNYDASTPTTLAYYLHGDGAADQANFRPVQETFYDEKGWIYLAPRANNDNWWLPGISSSPTAAFNDNIEANAKLLSNVLDYGFDNYNVCRNVIVGYSASGGSWFWDGYFSPTRGSKYPTYMNVGCGSSGIQDNFTWGWLHDGLEDNAASPSVNARTKIRWTVGTNDFLFQPAKTAVATYTALDFDVSTDYLTGVGHCGFDSEAKAHGWWNSLCASGDIPSCAAGGGNPGGGTPPGSGPMCNGVAATMVGTNASETLLGTPGRDVIVARGGNDVINGRGGNDLICAGDGADRVSGGAGNDRIIGGKGADVLVGAGGSDKLFGGPGNDELRGQAGADTLSGNKGTDVLSGGDGPDVLRGGAGPDQCTGGSGADKMFSCP